MLFINQG